MYEFAGVTDAGCRGDRSEADSSDIMNAESSTCQWTLETNREGLAAATHAATGLFLVCTLNFIWLVPKKQAICHEGFCGSLTGRMPREKREFSRPILRENAQVPV